MSNTTAPSAAPETTAGQRQPTSFRQRVMKCCTLATDAELTSAVNGFSEAATATDLRRPETGLVMLRGRVGGDGAPFNMGEATVTRAVVKLAPGATGYSYLLGRSAERARLAAILDALAQSSANSPRIDADFVQPVTARAEQDKIRHRAETAKTRVDFFTLVRGED